MSSHIRVGVVGVGSIGKNHARIYSGLPGVEFSAIFDTNPETATAVSQQFGVKAVTRTLGIRPIDRRGNGRHPDTGSLPNGKIPFVRGETSPDRKADHANTGTGSGTGQTSQGAVSDLTGWPCRTV